MNARYLENPPILIAIDLQPNSGSALQSGFELAVQRNAPVVVLHVVHENADTIGFYRAHDETGAAPMVSIAEDLLRERVDAELARLERSQRPEVVERKVVEGIPAGRIAEVADLLDAGCIVLADSGRSGFARQWFGSIVEAVRRHSGRELLVTAAPATHAVPPIETQSAPPEMPLTH